MQEILLPYYNNRRRPYIDTIVIHASAQHKASDLIDVLVKRELSAHYVVDETGEITRLVPEACRAWHAGVGSWRGETDINSTSIGIEMCNGLFGEEPFTPSQLNALAELCLHLIDKYDIKPVNIIGHSDLAPERKIDPGSMFPWQKMAKMGIGVWYNQENMRQTAQCSAAKMLQQIGYGIENLDAAEWAFCRHYNPELYCFLGGKKGMNKGENENLVLHDNPEYIRTLQAVYDAFAASEVDMGKILLKEKVRRFY